MELGLMASQSPIKVSEQTKERIRYLAALTDATQAEVVDHAVEEYAARHADVIEEGIERARFVLTGGDAATASHLLHAPLEVAPPIAPPPPLPSPLPSPTAHP